jgi:hypothetical protein
LSVASVAEVAGNVVERFMSWLTGGEQGDPDATAGRSRADTGTIVVGAGKPVLWQTVAAAPPSRVVLVLGLLAAPFLLWAAYRFDVRRERGWW